METEISKEDLGQHSRQDMGTAPPKSFKEALTSARNQDYIFDSTMDLLTLSSGGDRASESEGRCEPFVRTRERSNSPYRFRLVDRATPYDNRSSLDSSTPETSAIDSTCLHEVVRRRIRTIVKDLVTDSPLQFPSMDLLKLLFWNCRGAGNNNFKRNFVEIIRTYKPEIIILMETKVTFSSMGDFFNRLGFTASTVVDPVGRIGGIWIIWDTNHVNVRASSLQDSSNVCTI
ncbi:hypothetical protein LOK49_LG15G02259 [Camellia lanceoleosa]|uniref:Uncharacterized protein n=1 Tax=Camellia lanceoleosa TaxID=1840588 RepID=A0ACC0F3I5_9ERIC|nr:hypothetical protein LOK49_LG15G02259 [Camellia lanceoleosa]